MTLSGTRNATSLQEAASGPSQLDLLDGLTIDRSGPDRARVSPSRKLGNKPEQMIQGICGRTFFVSSVTHPLPDTDRLSLWENRLVERLASIGSTESALIWRRSVSPAGRAIYRLAPSMRHINGTESSGSPKTLWTTVSARDWKDSAGMATEATDGRVRLDQLPRQMMSYSPTPTVADVQGGRKHRSGTRKNEPFLNGLVMSYSATPRSSDGEKGGPNMSFGAGGTPLPTQIYAMAYSVTPQAMDGNKGALPPRPHDTGISLPQHMAATALGGPTPIGSSAPSMEKRGAPNPEFAFWLMGFPDAWVSGALAAMQSRPSSRRK